jgi:hypothetical protein
MHFDNKSFSNFPNETIKELNFKINKIDTNYIKQAIEST